ncbi:MAG TPA: bifunctional riboflavin kinase/FAD synthetase [Candidatus Binatia bacterium]|nr:bifunctional riboflavin kinase/FAD synthetase [Candidatus Binatia bacterium]
MKAFSDIEDQQLSMRGSVVTMGNFDGIHLGHQALVRHTVEESKQLGYPSIVLTFEPHPLKVLAPERAPRLLLSYQDKLDLFQAFGVDIVIAQRFDREFASIAAEDFVRRFLVGRLKTKKLWVGRDLRFGQGRKGGTGDLIRVAPEVGFQVGVLDPISSDGIRISSSRIRGLVEAGCVDEVRPMLGRYHFVSGRVVTGKGRGRKLGFPTANISSQTEVVPLNGIYATSIEVKSRQWLSVSSVGVNPTFGDGPRTVESFIFDFESEIYGEAVKLSFVKRIRDEKKFSTVEDLIAQMHGDVEQARVIFEDLRLPGQEHA